MGIGRLAARAAQGVLAAGIGLGISTQALAQDLLGQPTPKGIDLQPSGSALREQAHDFHNLLLVVITAISLFVLALLIICVVRFNKRSNPVPAKWSHNTPIEIIWTVVPVLILGVIAIFSFRLLFAYHDMPKPDLTVKATGYQWYWGYEYPDQGIAEITSNALTEEESKAKGVPYRLAADNALVVPVNKVVRVLVTGDDVIHAFGVPAFGIIIDAIPGRVNETWFKADKVGTYYGNCRELCGVDHSFMPIEIQVVSQAEFDAWTAAKAPAAPAATPQTLEAIAETGEAVDASTAASPPAASLPAPAVAPGADLKSTPAAAPASKAAPVSAPAKK